MRLKFFLLACVFLALNSGFAVAQDNYEVPTRTHILAAKATPARRIVLPNGMIILLKEAPSHNLTAVEMLCQVGLANEESPTTGLIALWSQILSERLDEATAENYRIVDKSISIEPDFLRFSIQGPAKDTEEMIKILADLVKNDQYPEELIIEKREKLIEDIEAGRAGSRNQLYSIFRSLFYRLHPYRRQHTSGSLAVERIDGALISQFHQRYLVPDRLVLATCGRFARTDLEDFARDQFTELKAKNAADLGVPWEPKKAEKRIDLATRNNIAWVLVGYPAPNAASTDHIPMKLINAILSTGLSSRLFNEIREKKGLAYTITSVHPDLKGPSHFLTYVITRPHDAGKVRRDVLKQAERLQKELLTPDELRSAKQKLRGSFLNERETNRGTAFRLARAESIGLGYGYEENFEKRLQEVTAQDIRRVAERYLLDPTVIIARPGGKLYWDG